MATGARAGRTRERRIRRTATLTGGITFVVVAALIGLAAPVSFIEMRTLEYVHLCGLIPPRDRDPNIEAIDVGPDAGAYDALRLEGDAPDTVLRVPRRAYAKAVRLLSRWGAKAIVFDMMFRLPGGAGDEGKSEDEELAQAFRDAGNVVVAASTKAKPDAVALQDPVAPLSDAVWAVGSPIAPQPNEVVHSVSMAVRDHDTGRQYLALPLLAFQRFVGAEPSDMKLSEGRWVLTGGRRLPLLPGERISLLPWARPRPPGGDRSVLASVEVVRGSNVEEVPALTSWNALLINWVGPKGTIQPHLMGDVLSMQEAEGRKLFGGKAVVIGDMEWDEHGTTVGPMPGPEVQANALDTLISGAFIRRMDPWGFLALLTGLAAATTLLVQRLRALHSVLAVLVLMVCVLLVARELYVRKGVWMYLFVSELSIGLSWGITIALQSQKVSSLLSRFVPSFLGEAEQQALGEVRTLDASILWSDIRSYTSISEQVSAEDMLRLLHSYHSAAEDIITKHGGTIVKTPGDAILSVFWRETGRVNHATCALRAGREIIDNLPRLAREWEAAGIEFDTGVGINTGSVAMGLVGKQHLEPTVIGDAVNVAQRLESLTKELGYPLIFSDSVRERLEEDVPAVCLDEVAVRGRTEPLRVYGVGGQGPAHERTPTDTDHAATEGQNEI